MVCLHCGAKTHIANSRSQKKTNQVWRRRQCLNCAAVFTTEETADYSGAWRVEAGSGHVEAFERDKLFLSLYKACGHRKTALSDASGLTDTIIAKLLAAAPGGVINRTQISQISQVALNRFDKAASSYYAARHR
jgi:transcriptional repressor NrdR